MLSVIRPRALTGTMSAHQRFDVILWRMTLQCSVWKCDSMDSGPLLLLHHHQTTDCLCPEKTLNFPDLMPREAMGPRQSAQIEEFKFKTTVCYNAQFDLCKMRSTAGSYNCLVRQDLQREERPLTEDSLSFLGTRLRNGSAITGSAA